MEQSNLLKNNVAIKRSSLLKPDLVTILNPKQAVTRRVHFLSFDKMTN